jgi:hypothetical protein
VSRESAAIPACYASSGMKCSSGRNLQSKRAVVEVRPEAEIVQQPTAQLPWFHLPTVEQLKSLLGSIKEVSSQEPGGKE